MKKLLILLCAAATLSLAGCGDSLEKQVVGKWKYSFTADLKDTNGTMKVECADEFYPNKSVTHDCKFTAVVNEKAADGTAVKVDMAGSLKGTGEWSVKDKTVYDKTVDGNATIDGLAVNGTQVMDQAVLKQVQNDMSRFIMKGDTSKMKTIAIDQNKWTFEMEVEKKEMTISATRG